MRIIITILFCLPLLAFGQIGINNNTVQVSATGDLTYSFIHGIAYKDSTSYKVSIGTRYVYYKLLPGTVVFEAEGVTIAGDSITILTAGDYVIQLSLSMDGGINEDYHLKMFVNNAKAPTPQGSCFMTTTGANNFENTTWWWYRTLAVGDDLSFRLANNTNTGDPNIRSFKVYIYKVPEH